MSQSDPSTADQQLLRAVKLINEKSYPEAERLLRALAEANSGDGRTWTQLGHVYFRTRRFERASEAYWRAQQLDPNNPNANYNFGAALAEWRQVAEARRHLERAIELKPDFPQATERLARLSTPYPAPPWMHHTGPSPTTAAPTAGPAERAPADRYDPGGLIMAGRPRLSSFVGRFVLVAVLAVLSIGVGLIEAPHDRTLVRSLSGIADLEDRYDYVREHFPGDSATRRAAKRDIASREDAVDTAFAIVGGGLLVAALLLALHALGAAAMTRYHVYEWRIDVEHGGIRRVAYSVWLWEVTDAVYHRPPGLLLTNTAEIVLGTERSDRPVRVTGLASAREMRALWGGSAPGPSRGDATSTASGGDSVPREVLRCRASTVTTRSAEPSIEASNPVRTRCSSTSKPRWPNMTIIWCRWSRCSNDPSRGS